MYNKYLYNMCVYWFDDFLINKYWFYKLYLEMVIFEKYFFFFKEIMWIKRNINYIGI